MTALSVNVGNASKTYDGSATSSTGALVYPIGYDPALVSGNALYTANSANAGTYTGANLRASGLYSSQFGYDIEMLAGTLTIDKAALSITASNASKTYGQTASLSGFSTSGLIAGDQVSGVDLASLGSVFNAGVGNYAIAASNAQGTGLGNYDITYGNGTLTIDKAALTIIASDASKTAGQVANLSGFTTAGLVAGTRSAVSAWPAAVPGQGLRPATTPSSPATPWAVAWPTTTSAMSTACSPSPGPCLPAPSAIRACRWRR